MLGIFAWKVLIFCERMLARLHVLYFNKWDSLWFCFDMQLITDFLRGLVE